MSKSPPSSILLPTFDTLVHEMDTQGFLRITVQITIYALILIISSLFVWWNRSSASLSPAVRLSSFKPTHFKPFGA